MSLSKKKGELSTPRTLLVGLSFVSLAIYTGGAIAHYSRWAWGNPWQPAGWLLAMFFLIVAFAPHPRQIASSLQLLITPKAALIAVFLLFFVVAHLWNFRTAPWNGNGVFDDAAQDLLFLKTHATSRPFQAAWFQPYGFIAHETLFHYYLWPWLHLFGYNILTNEAALLARWSRPFSSHFC